MNTPEWVWQAIAPFIPKDKVVWEAFGIDPLIPSSNYLLENEIRKGYKFYFKLKNYNLNLTIHHPYLFVSFVLY
jgi:hypothetical protein